ncbi:MAG TPA: hypothetical protein P5270_02545 [Victivallales bacterium]|nr:hypothetical protein [Victivallales bacterium]HPO89768.1 hypothetical protein [Victivallales bacterium]HRR28217.1 hypothetical protein [Victivallales bacterium]HRU02174.1 hypothetical protein [Victivallales bacterium]
MNKIEKSPERFIPIVMKVCSTTEVFFDLLNTSFRRAIFHFILLSICASIFFVSVRVPTISNSATKYCQILDRYFGGIRISPEGLFPIKNPQENKSVILGKLKIDYISEDAPTLELSDAGALKGIIWLPNSLYFWIKTPLGYQYFPILSSTTKIKTTNSPVSKLDTIVKIAKKENIFPAKSYKNISEAFKFSDTKTIILLTTIIIYFIFFLFNIIFSVPLYALMILLIFTFFGSELLKKIKASTFFSLLLYMSFPGIIIATLYSALSLPLLEFRTIVFSALIIYSFFVINSIQKKLYPQKQDDDYDDDDIF